jgi:RNA polymerase sigma factor (TIGR02999 family)
LPVPGNLFLEDEELTRSIESLLPAATRSQAINQALPALYQELRDLAAGYLRHERPDHTLQPTALVHESYLRLRNQHSVDWSDRLQCLSIAARMMRRILANHAAARATEKRGSAGPKLELDAALESFDQQSFSITAVDDALHDLEKFDARQANIVELRFFAGLTFEETAEVVGISVRTAKREWAVAKRWLRRELSAP